jgi:hypothetical protein
MLGGLTVHRVRIEHFPIPFSLYHVVAIGQSDVVLDADESVALNDALRD